MKIERISLKEETEKCLYQMPRAAKPGDAGFKIGFSVSPLSERAERHFGMETVSTMHLLLEGQGKCQYTGSKVRELVSGGVCSCEEKEKISVTGTGRLFNMWMDGGVRGFIRQMEAQAEIILKLGESVGESVVAYLGIGGGFSMTDGAETYRCDRDEALILSLERKEFKKITLKPERPGQMLVSATGVCLSPWDFGKYIGVKFLERGEGTCKTRLDIRPEHMNPIQTVHGGCLFTLADATCGVAASSTGGICTTVNSNIQFLNAAFSPKYLIAEAKPKKVGRKIRSFIVDIWDDKGVLICTADFVFYSLQQ